MHARITQLINESIETKQRLHELTLFIEQSAQTIITALQNGKKILACGNGGSAADAQHFVAELVGRFEGERKPLPAIALNTNVSTLTAIGNDYGYDELFARQIRAFGEEGDVFVGISTSGKSQNILKAIDAAIEKEMHVITLGGKDGGTMKMKPGMHVIAPSQTTSRIQECHILIIHIWCKLLDETLLHKL
ncbi:D-sedoheptulose 7-phosphate isomerase [Candidatus Woesearchaeota archaeon]|nr:D-sedoheptulose 7-phosphate isomerase [Candidatus Woesearchaeota archaeon]